MPQKEHRQNVISRRNMFSLMGLATFTGVAVASTGAAAQTSGMERHDERENRRDQRRGTTDKPAQPQPAQTQSPPKQ
jgi:hypothetical protein